MERKSEDEQGRIPGISRSPSTFLPAKNKEVTDKLTNGRMDKFLSFESFVPQKPLVHRMLRAYSNLQFLANLHRDVGYIFTVTH